MKKDIASTIYFSVVESLMYAMVCTRLDIAHAVGVVSRFMVNPRKDHWEAVKWIFRYLRGSSKLCLTFGDSKPILEGYVDANWVGDLDGRKSTSGYLFTFVGELYHGNQDCRSVLPYLQLKLSILQLKK